MSSPGYNSVLVYFNLIFWLEPQLYPYFSREFFTDQGGRCTVEFFKEADTKDRLYVALRFDTKDIAKEVLNRYY